MLFRSLHFLYPAVPGFGGQLYDLQPFFTTPPWNAIGWTPIPIFPYAVGLAFFMPLDLSFSCWFFYLFWKAERVFGSVLGLRNLPKFPYIEAQTSGAYIGLCVLAIWSTRHHIKQMFSTIFHRNKAHNMDSTGEPISYANALLGAVIGFTLLIAFSVKAGMTFGASMIFFLIYFVLSIGIPRIRAELRSPVHDLHRAGAHFMMVVTLGSRAFPAVALTRSDELRVGTVFRSRSSPYP